MPSGRIQRLTTYHAVYRLAARPYALSHSFAAAGRFQYATLFHPATSIYKVELRNVWVGLESNSVAGILSADLMRLTTAPATGNPAITPVAPDRREPADGDTVTLALPTSQGTESDLISSVEWNAGVIGASTGSAPLGYVDLLSPAFAGYNADELSQMAVLRPGVAEGFAVTLDSTAVTVVNALVIVRYTRAAYIGNQG